MAEDDLHHCSIRSGVGNRSAGRTAPRRGIIAAPATRQARDVSAGSSRARSGASVSARRRWRTGPGWNPSSDMTAGVARKRSPTAAVRSTKRTPRRAAHGVPLRAAHRRGQRAGQPPQDRPDHRHGVEADVAAQQHRPADGARQVLEQRAGPARDLPRGCRRRWRCCPRARPAPAARRHRRRPRSGRWRGPAGRAARRGPGDRAAIGRVLPSSIATAGGGAGPPAVSRSYPIARRSGARAARGVPRVPRNSSRGLARTCPPG